MQFRSGVVLLSLCFVVPMACSSGDNPSPNPPPTDSGVVDAGRDAGSDAGGDGGVIVGVDAGSDAGVAACCTGLSASKTGGTTIDGGAIYSSTRLLVSWSPGAASLARYRVTSTDGVTSVSSTVLVDAGTTSTTLTGLKSSTSYTVSVAGCVDFACTTVAASDASVSGTTEEEYWQLQGSSARDSFDAGTLIVSDGNTKAYVVRYPSDAGAPAALEGRVRLYYDSNDPNRKGVSIALSTGVVSSSPSSANAFSNAGDAGLFRPSTATTLINSNNGLLTSQAVPLPASMGAKIRLFFEGEGSDSRTRILSIDSNDGYVGEDFNAGAATKCHDAGDYAGGGCTPAVIVGVAADDAGTGLVEARQFKIGYPTLSSWIWDGDAGAFMVITSEDTCGTTTDGLSYATWNGAKWNVEKTPDGGTCARFLVTKGHGPVVVHLGGARYKLYYEDSTNGMANKPLRVIYADGTRTGGPTTVEFDDWESSSTARQVNFLWPSGNKLSASSESGLGDHVIYCPTGDVDTQFMYMNLGGSDDPTWNMPPWGLGMAVLANP